MDGSGVKRKMDSQQRERAGSQDSRQESTAKSAFGANLLNLPAGYQAVRSAKISSLTVRLLSGGSAIPYQPIGSSLMTLMLGYGWPLHSLMLALLGT
jgi:hypothetical protein